MNARDSVPRIAHALLDGSFGREWRTASVQSIENTSNQVLRLDLPAGSVALRVPRFDSEITQVDRHSECKVLQRVAERGIAPEVIACDAESGVLVTQWIAGDVWTMQRARESEAIAQVATLLKELHKIVAPPGVREIDLARIIDSYLQQIRRQIRGGQSELSIWCLRQRPAALRRVADASGVGTVLCHCDVHHRNLVAGARLVLLDWEYSGRADALFDLASFASYHELDAAQTRHLLQAYGIHEAVARSFDSWRWLFKYVWLLWLLATAARTPESGTTEQMTRLVGQLLARE